MACVAGVTIAQRRIRCNMLVGMAVFDTIENKRSSMTEQTLASLSHQVNWDRNRLIISDNGSCEETQDLYRIASRWFPFKVVKNGENLGTARAINRAWSYREPGEHLLKMDNDCVVNTPGWADDIEEAFSRDPSIGICGLKRKDLAERPDSPEPHYRSDLRFLSHEPGQRWIAIEECLHIMGTCQGFSSALFDKIGYLYQAEFLYGFDDSIASLRARLAGFKTVFLPTIDVDHIDPGGTAYSNQKKDDAGKQMARYGEIVTEYRTGKRDIYFDGGDDANWAREHL